MQGCASLHMYSKTSIFSPQHTDFTEGVRVGDSSTDALVSMQAERQCNCGIGQNMPKSCKKEGPWSHEATSQGRALPQKRAK